jgi:two-component system, NtrC family, sensor kinase
VTVTTPQVTTSVAVAAAPAELLPILTRFARDLASHALTKEELFGRLAETGRMLFQAEGAAVVEMVDDEHYVVVAPSGTLTALAGRRLALKEGQSIFRDVIRHRRAEFMNDAVGNPRLNPDVERLVGIRQLAVAPILRDGAVIAMLTTVNPASGAVDEHLLALLEYLAAQGAVVLHTEQLLQRAHQATDEARSRAEDAARAANANAVLAASARAFANAPNRVALYNSLAAVLVNELHAVGYAVYEANPRLRTARFETQWGVINSNAEQIATNFWQTALGDIVSSGEPIFVSEFSNAEEHTLLHVSLREAGVESAALLPLLIEERAQGLLSVRFSGAHLFDEGEKQLLADITAQFALAFRNTMYVDEVERRAHRLTVLARAQQQLTQLASEDSLPNGIAEAVDLVLPSRSCDVFTLSGTDLRRVVRLENGTMVSSDIAPMAELTLARLTADTGVSRLASHLFAGPDAPRGTTELCAAVRFGHRSAGVIRLLSSADHPFDAQDLDLITIIARHAGTAVETARLFSLQDLQRQRAEGAAELARVTLQAVNLEEGAAELLAVLDRNVPSIGKAIGVARGRDGLVEYITGSGTLDGMRGVRPAAVDALGQVGRDGKPVEFASLRQATSGDLQALVPDEWGYLVPLLARDRVLGVLLVSAPKAAPLLRRDRITLERLSSSLALAIDALLLDEEERLSREREHLLATALTTINHPIFILDRLGVRYANPAAAREYGWSQSELMEMRFEDLVVGEDAREGVDMRSGVVASGVRLSNDVHRRLDGSEFPAVVTVSPLTGHDGDVLGQVVSVRNVSQDRRLEEQLRTTEKMVALGELVAGVAHEINNPLTGISAFAQILLEEELGDEQRESVQLIKQESDRAKGVINDLLLFARKTERGSGPVDVNTVIEQTVRLRSYPLRNAKVTLKLELDSQHPLVSGDSQKLQQVLLNIISNAEHAMQERSERTLTLRTARDGDQVIIHATDTGKGMPAEIIRRIFEPFFSTKPAGIGTGLGLSVAYGIINAHGGTITVDSEPDVGTTVTIVLPALAV